MVMPEDSITAQKLKPTITIYPVLIDNESHAVGIMRSLGVSPQGAKIMSSKSVYSVFKIEGIRSWEANIIKQHLLSLGADAALERNALMRNIKTDILIFGTVHQLRQLCQKLKNQPFSLKEVACGLSFYLTNMHKQTFRFRARDKVLKISKPLVCGIINITHDSFSYDGLLRPLSLSAAAIKEAALKKAEAMISQGAAMLDIGGESSRPFSRPIPAAQEIKRVIPVISVLRKEFKDIILSVDTYKYAVAQAACDAGIDVINDISALRINPEIAALIKKHKLGCIIMHMKGTPRTMQRNPHYEDVIGEVSAFFKERLSYCDKTGIAREQICLDPGIGFGKRLEDNTRLLNELYAFKVFGLPLFVGLSRKSFIGTILKKDVQERLNGTIAASVISVMRGANILRAHDVKETTEALSIALAITCN